MTKRVNQLALDGPDGYMLQLDESDPRGYTWAAAGGGGGGGPSMGGGIVVPHPQHIAWADYQWQSGSSWNMNRGFTSIQTSFGTGSGVTAHTPSSASFYASRKKLRHFNNAINAASRQCGAEPSLGGFDGPRLGGFGGCYLRSEFGLDATAAVANLKGYLVLINANAGGPNINNTTTQPSSMVNCFGIGWDSGDANLQVLHNDSAGGCTKIDLGASFPANTRGVDWYRLEFYWEANGPVEIKLTNVTTGAVTTQTLATNLPGGTVGLAYATRIGNHDSAPGGTMYLDMGRIYLEIP